jgi:hypothetical protein
MGTCDYQDDHIKKKKVLHFISVGLTERYARRRSTSQGPDESWLTLIYIHRICSPVFILNSERHAFECIQKH